MAGVNGWEFILLIVLAVVILGPERLPEYAAKLGRMVRQVRAMAEGAKGQLREQMGPDFDDIDWRQYDPRQYDPRRIVREALVEPLDEAFAPVREEIDGVRNAAKRRDLDAEETGSVDGGDEAAYDRDIEPVTHLAPLSGGRDWDPTRPTPYDVDAT